MLSRDWTLWQYVCEIERVPFRLRRVISNVVRHGFKILLPRSEMPYTKLAYYNTSIRQVFELFSKCGGVLVA